MDLGPVDTGDGDGAERAFEALREEVAGLRRGIEQVSRQRGTAAAGVAAVDYSPTLGAIAKGLQAVEGRLGVIEGKPALVLTPARFETEIRKAGGWASEEGVSAMRSAASAMEGASREFKEMLAGARSHREQQVMLGMTGIVGVMGGVALWFLAVAALPWGTGHRMAALMIDGDGRWGAAETLMREADPSRWKRVVGLIHACPEDTLTELCEAAMAVRTLPQGQPMTASEIPKAGSAHGRAGQGR